MRDGRTVKKQRTTSNVCLARVCVWKGVCLWSAVTTAECDSPVRELREALWHQFVIISCLCREARILNDETVVRACVFTCVGVCSVSLH